MSHIHPNHRHRVEIGILVPFLLIAAVLGWKSLRDVDIGWHVAGGLWMLRHQEIVLIDPFGSDSQPWVAYSWLFEIIVGLIFQHWSFLGLQIAQFLYIVGATAIILAVLAMGEARESAGVSLRKTVVGITAAIALTLPLFASLWHLRPQLLSGALFAVVFSHARRIRARGLITYGDMLLAFVLTILWANLHVYWILSPLIFATVVGIDALVQRKWRLCRQTVLLTILVSGAGFLTPYGILTYTTLLDYSLHHSAANALIREFQPLRLRLGYPLPLTCAIALLVALKARAVIRAEGLGVLILLVALLAWTLLRLKILPLFALAAQPILARSVIPFFMSDVEGSVSVGSELKRSRRRIAMVLAALLIVLCFTLIDRADPLTARVQQLARLAEEIKSSREGPLSPITVLNHFDDGGWLALFFFDGTSGELLHHPAIDGRTLVMGERRLREFDLLRRSDPASCEILSRWDPTWALLPRASFPTAELRVSCLSDWDLVAETEDFVLLRHRVGATESVKNT